MAKSPKAPTNAPAQVSAVTAEGAQKKTAPTFNQNPTLKPNPPSKQVKIVQPDGQPAARGPQAPLGGTSYGNQQQPIDK